MTEVKKCLKADFRLHVSKNERCADHCTVHVVLLILHLSGTYSHVHEIRCDACRGIEKVIKDILVKIDDAESPNLYALSKTQLKFEHDKAREAIASWKAHNLRAINQDIAKQDIICELNGNNCLIVMDWAMKFLPLRYKEQMRVFFLERKERAGTLVQ